MDPRSKIDPRAQARVDALTSAARARDGQMEGYADMLGPFGGPEAGLLNSMAFPVYKASTALAKASGPGKLLPLFDEAKSMSASARKSLISEMKDFMGAWYPGKLDKPEWLRNWAESLGKGGGSNAEILGTIPQELTQSLYQSLKHQGYGGVKSAAKGSRDWEDILKFEQGNPSYLPKAPYPSQTRIKK